MKKISLIFIMMLCLVLAVGCKKGDDNQTKVTASNAKGNKTNTDEKGNEMNLKDLLSGKHKVKIDIIDYGVIEVELDADEAPISVTNFINLVNEKFYDGLTFHRIIKDFMMQGGDPNGDGTGGSDVTIKGEFIDNGVENSLSHTRGAISMARAQDYNSASSQFFICHKDALYLNGQYAVFGYVTSGMDVVDTICENIEVVDDNGTVEAENQPVIKSITVVK